MAFVWGIIRLIKAQPLPESYGLEDPSGGNISNWGFGQVVALVLLVAPFNTYAEYFCDGEFCNALRFSSMLNRPRSASGQDTKHNMRNDSASDETRYSLPQTKGANNLDTRVSTAISGGSVTLTSTLTLTPTIPIMFGSIDRGLWGLVRFLSSFLCFPVHCLCCISCSLQLDGSSCSR